MVPAASLSAPGQDYVTPPGDPPLFADLLELLGKAWIRYEYVDVSSGPDPCGGGTLELGAVGGQEYLVTLFDDRVADFDLLDVKVQSG